ncbi:MAG: type I secretion system permease/ATPase, partial [Wolbachia pipientis]|nr:type I secretion system permease/ATPase [Wolbachia pipientis]
LARAFYGNIKLLVLDEPNANLDSNGEACLIKAIDNAKKQNITTVIITHKLLLVSLVDKVIFISEGTICAIGPKDEILGKLVVTTLPNIRGEDEQFSVSGG